MATARKLPSGNWRVRLFLGTDSTGVKRYKSFTAGSKREVERLAINYEAEHLVENDMRFGEAVERYISSKSSTLSPSTIHGYRTIAKNYTGLIRDIRLSKLTNELLQRQLDAVAATCAPKTVRNAQGLISAVLKMFPCSFTPRMQAPAKVKVEVLIPSDEDIKKMLAAAAGRPIEIAILLAAFGSLRRGEICGLCVECVHADHITIKRTVVKDSSGHWILKEQPKTYAGYRDVPLPADVMEKVHNAIHGKAPSDRVLDMCPQTIYTAYKRVLKRAGVPDFKFHALRHYFATFCHSIGIPDQYIAEIGGWDDTATLTKIYQHTMKNKKHGVAEMINNYYSELKKDDTIDDTTK